MPGVREYGACPRLRSAHGACPSFERRVRSLSQFRRSLVPRSLVPVPVWGSCPEYLACPRVLLPHSFACPCSLLLWASVPVGFRSLAISAMVY